jgi:hypothetical protein
VRRAASIVFATVLLAACGGGGSGGRTDERSSATALGGLAERAQQDLADLGAHLSAVGASGQTAEDALALQSGATTDAVDRLRSLEADVEQGADRASPSTRPAFLALGRAAGAYLGVLQELAVHQGSRPELARFLCHVPERRDAVADVRLAVTAFDRAARGVRARTGIPVTQFGGDHAQSLDDAYVTATYAAGCLSIDVDVLGGAVVDEVSSTGPDATAASGAREVAAFAAGVVSVLGPGPPHGARTAVARLWTATAATARLEQTLWTRRAAAYAARRRPSVAALEKRERALVAVWLAASRAV